jgi:predicted enzyme related to lactoylglutathione lyase
MSTVVIWVSDLEKSVNFYSALFEDNSPYRSLEFASVQGLGNEVLIHLLPEQYRSEPTLGEENPIKPVLDVQSIDKARLAAGRTGGKIKSQVMEHNNWTYADGNDPDGNIIQVREGL